MMSKFALNFLVLVFVSTACFAQTDQQKLDEIKNNPVTAKDAARADTRLINKKAIVDKHSLNAIQPKRKYPASKPKRKRKSKRNSI